MKMLDLFKELMIDDDAALKRKFPLAEKEPWGNFISENITTFGCNRCAEETPHAEAEKECGIGKQETKFLNPRGNYNVLTHWLKIAVVVLTSQFCRHFLQTVEADDRTKGSGFHTQKREGFMSGQVRKTKCWLKLWSLMAGRSCIAASALKSTSVQEPSVGDANTDIPARLRGKHLQAVSTRHGRSWSASSSSGGRPYVGVQAKEAELREEIKRLKKEGKKPAVQFEEPGEDAKLGEDCKMELDGEADSGLQLEIRKKEITKELRENEDLKNLDVVSRTGSRRSGHKMRGKKREAEHRVPGHESGSEVNDKQELQDQRQEKKNFQIKQRQDGNRWQRLNKKDQRMCAHNAETRASQ